MGIERRQYARYLSHRNAFAALGRQYSIVGKIKNIALGGLAFEYIGGDSPDEDTCEADIFIVGNVFHLHNIPCRIIYDYDVYVPYVNSSYVKKLTTKRCGLKFERLSKEMTTQLILFLEAHTQETFV